MPNCTKTTQNIAEDLASYLLQGHLKYEVMLMSTVSSFLEIQQYSIIIVILHIVDGSFLDMLTVKFKTRNSKIFHLVLSNIRALQVTDTCSH